MVNITLQDIPNELYQQIKVLAQRDHRDLNQQLLVLLEQAVQTYKRPKTKVLEQIDRQREAIATRVGMMPDSTELIAPDRHR